VTLSSLSFKLYDMIVEFNVDSKAEYTIVLNQS